MLNSDNVDFKYLSNSNHDIRFFGSVSLDCNYSQFSCFETLSKVTSVSNLHTIKKKMLTEDLKENESSINNINGKSGFFEMSVDNNVSHKVAKSIEDFVAEPRLLLRSPRLSRPIIATKKIKALMSKNVLNRLPTDVQQHLVSLMPICDQIFTSDDRRLSLSDTAMDNEFFNRALIRFLWKFTKGKTIFSKETFLNRIKSVSTTKLPKNTTSSHFGAVTDDSLSLNPNSVPIQSPSISSIRWDDDNNEAKVNYNCGIFPSPVLAPQSEYRNSREGRKDTEVTSSNYTLINSEFDTVHLPCGDIVSNAGCHGLMSPSCDVIMSHKTGKHSRAHSDSATCPVTNTRPTRSTAGQLPARLKSSSPQSATQGTIISALLGRSQSPKPNKSLPGRKRQKEKRKYKVCEHNSLQEQKPTIFHNDTILLNLRTKLSKRMEKNLVKDYSDINPGGDSNFLCQSDSNCFNSKSPTSLSPDSDKLPFLDSPLSRNSQNNFKYQKFKNQYFENQTPNSPQWSFSSEFTSQSSVESVLSQKNIRIDLEEVTMSENLLEDMNTEEMPPPRRTLTVAAMREKMRAKKMAKEEKRKDFDKEFPFEVDGKGLEILERHCQSAAMSNMMGMCHDNDDDSMANEFDSFIIDDYHEEIDDKILNYSDDLDDLLLAGGNESLLEIIMKDPDAMEIGNDSFGTLNVSDSHQRSPMILSDRSKFPFSSTSSQCHSSGSSSDTYTDTCGPVSNTNHHRSSRSVASSSSPTSIPTSSPHSTIDHKSLLSQALTSVIQKSDSSPSLASQNAYLVDGNGLSDALKLIQSLHPAAKVTTQQFYLVNKGPQLVLSQAPPTQPSSSRPITAVNNPPITVNQSSPAMSSTVTVLPQFTSFAPKPSANVYSINSNVAACKLPPLSSACSQPTPIFTAQKPIVSLAQMNQNPYGIRLQLAQNFPTGQQLNIIQSPSSSQMINNQSVQFIPRQSNNSTNNISLITQSQPMSKFVFLYPNLNLAPDPQQQLILLSSEPATPTYQVINGGNIWQQINPNLNSFLGSASNSNNLVLMNPQSLTNQSFAFNYNHQSPLITTATSGSNLVMMSTSHGPKLVNQSHPHNKLPATGQSTSSLSVSVPKPNESNVNSNSSQNSSSVEQLSNSSSSANSKLSFDEKISGKSQNGDNFADSDQERSINSPQFHLLNTTQLANKHRATVTVDLDSLSPSNSIYHNNGNLSIRSQNDDQLDFEIPCLYSTKIDLSIDKVNGEFDI